MDGAKTTKHSPAWWTTDDFNNSTKREPTVSVADADNVSEDKSSTTASFDKNNRLKFIEWLDKRGVSSSDIFVVLSSLKRCAERVKAEQIIDDDIYHVISAETMEAICSFLLADKDFINAERCRGDQFTNALNLYSEFFDEQLTPPIAEVIAEPETGMEPSIGTTMPTVSEIEMLLSEEVFSPLKIALAKENIRTIEELKALKLWAFMNQKNLYSISMRQTVLTKVRQLLEPEIAENPKLLYELHCGAVVYKPFCPYSIDLDFFRDARKEFDIHEWIDIVLMAVDYNPAGYVDENGVESEAKKLFFLRRLLPFVEKRVNLIELAPKGTGKSYVFEKISKRGWLISGGTVSRASLIYDNAKKTGGLLTRFDYVGFDEVQSITFEQPGQIQQALKHYMEFGEIKGFDAALTAEAGVIVLGNINAERFDINKNMVEHISEVFGESATLDRFHGFIPGWEIPRMTTGMIAHGWALNTEYFAEVLHELRSDLSYASTVDSLISYKSNADKRDLTAIKRLCTAFLKLLFPHVQSPDDISKEDFEHYCLEPALEMRGVIKKQLCIIDPKEFNVPGKNTIPEVTYSR